MERKYTSPEHNWAQCLPVTREKPWSPVLGGREPRGNGRGKQEGAEMEPPVEATPGAETGAWARD